MEQLFQEWFKNSEGNLNSFQIFASKYLPVLIQVLVCIIIVHFLMNVIKKRIKKSKRIPKNVQAFLATGIRFLLYFIIIVTVCNRMGIDITSLVAAFSIVGVAVSLSIPVFYASAKGVYSCPRIKKIRIEMVSTPRIKKSEVSEARRREKRPARE